MRKLLRSPSLLDVFCGQYDSKPPDSLANRCTGPAKGIQNTECIFFFFLRNFRETEKLVYNGACEQRSRVTIIKVIVVT